MKEETETSSNEKTFVGIPYSILSQMDDIRNLTPNQIWVLLKQHFERNACVIRNRKTSTLNEFNNFKLFPHKPIHVDYDRFNLICVRINNTNIHKSQHEIKLKFLKSLTERWKTVKLIIQMNLAINIALLYELYGELQSYESSVHPPTTMTFGGLISLIYSRLNQSHFNNQGFNQSFSQNQIAFYDQIFNHFSQTAFQNQDQTFFRN